jgi:hypothetical protein
MNDNLIEHGTNGVTKMKSTASQAAQINDLHFLVKNDMVGPRDIKFAMDLLRSFNRYGGLSAKQWPWVGKLIERAQLPDEEPETIELGGDFSGMLVMFEFAKQNLKYPKVRLMLSDGSPLVLSVAGPKAKVPGSINVTDGGSFGNNIWYGRVSKDGKFEPCKRDNAQERMEEVTDKLKEFAQDPVQTATAHGHLSGHCCFCNKALTDEPSVKAGYGPVCAKNFGLKWGGK